MLAKFFIERPVLANVIAFVTILLGAVALGVLPVSQYPPITPPTVQVTTTYPGASAKTLVETVALPIEQQVNGVEKMLYMQSNCTSDGRYTLTVTFQVGTDLDFAQVLVQNRVSAAMAQLPGAVQQQGVVTKKKETSPLQIITLSSKGEQFDALFLSNFATLQLSDKLARLPGVGDVVVFGVGEYSMRVWLDPEQMRQRSLMPSDVVSALQSQNAYVAAGQVGMPPTPAGQDFQITANVPSSLSDAPEFGEIILKTAANGQITRIRDIGRVELGARSYSQVFRMDGKPAGGIAIYQLPGANALDTAKGVRRLLATLAPGFPQGLEYSIPFDTTTFVKESVTEVYHTLFEAGLLVLVVIVVFLQDWRATLVPATTVPVTIIGAFAGMAAMGFSINLLTLFAVVLAIGIVVDDAIVVVEGVSQHVERGQTPKQGAIDAMRELFGPIIGITLVLMSVFLPPAFMPGITGQMYRQFALVIAVTALISAVNALTLKPTQCALWLRARDPKAKKAVFFRWFNAVYEPLERRYVRVIRFMVERSGRMAAVALVLIGLAGWGLTRVPTGFIPTEDQGYVMIAVQMPDGASLERTQNVMDRVSKIGLETPGAAHAIAIGTGGPSPLDGDVSLANAGIVYLMLKNWSERGQGGGPRRRDRAPPAPARGGAGGAHPRPRPGPDPGPRRLERLPDAGRADRRQLRLRAAPARDRRDRAGGQPVAGGRRRVHGLPRVGAAGDAARRQDPGGDAQRQRRRRLQHGPDLPGLELRQPLHALRPQLHGLPAGRPAAPPERRRRQEPLRAQLRGRHGPGRRAGRDPSGPRDLGRLALQPVPGGDGQRACRPPVTARARRSPRWRPIANRVLPRGMSFEWTAMSYQERLVGGTRRTSSSPSRSCSSTSPSRDSTRAGSCPAAVILAVPMALLGTAAALLGLGLANNIYVQIGLVLLIALSAKNAILIVEMAREGREKGRSIEEATVDASRVRFRPILMTSFTFILGVLPLVLATGAGAAARRSLGVAVATGMLASTGLAVLFVPSLYVVLQRWIERRTPAPQAHPLPGGERAG